MSRAPVTAAPAPERAPAPVPATAERQVARRSDAGVTRFTEQEYGYIRREVRRILIVATLIIILIVVLSFFLP